MTAQLKAKNPPWEKSPVRRVIRAPNGMTDASNTQSFAGKTNSVWSGQNGRPAPFWPG